MKLKCKIYLFFFGLFISFIPGVSVYATTYVVSAVSSTGAESAIGTYTDYATAKNAMNSYPSTENKVAVMKVNGKIVNAKYAIVHLNYDKNSPLAENGNNEHRLYPTSSSNEVYTTVHAAYGNDAAFVDYDPYGGTQGRIKIKISGYTGWMNAPYATIIPVSLLESSAWVASLDSSWLMETSSNSVKVMSAPRIGIRENPNTSANIVGYTSQGTVYTFTEKHYDGKYTWYRVKLTNSSLKTYYEHYNTGCLIHYYATYNSQGWTNLGLAPSFLKKGSKYYSFDGNYYYQTITAMLDDYRENTSKRAVNSNSIYYPYYLYLPVHSKTRYTADDFNQGIINRGYTSKNASVMYGEGINFIASQNQYGVNALLTFSAAINESATGTSAIARDKNNLFGHNAYGSNPYANATTYASVADSIMAHARMTGQSYNNPYDARYYGGHYGNKQSGMNVKYATDPYWGEKAAMNAFITDNSYGLQEFNGTTIGVTTKTGVIVRKQPSVNGQMIYPLKNISSDVSHIPLTVFDRVYSEGAYWYKIYTDPALNSNQDLDWSGTYDFAKSYGYIRADELFVSNTQPVITAQDITVAKGGNLNLLSGVSASDKEDGNLTDRIQVEGTVYINIPGVYEITYSVSDNQQFSAHKKVQVTVKGDVEPVITASNREVLQYTTFDPLYGVRASDDVEGDLTSKIQILSNTVDISRVGTYKVLYEVTNSKGKKATKEISVTVILNEKPVIHAENIEIPLHSNFDALDGVSASDKEDGDISVITVIENTVDTEKLGTYKVTYQVKDKANQITTKTITVKVVEKKLRKMNGRFYLSSLQEKKGKLIIKGYHTIDGIDNDLNTQIKYELVLKNEQDQSEYKQELKRFTNEKEMDMPILSVDGKNYKYAWFEDEIDTSKIKQGDYKAYLRTSTDTYYSESIVQNILFNTQEVQYNNDGKYVTLLNDYFNNDIPITFIVRDEKIENKQTDAADIQYTYIKDASLKDNILNIHFAAYSVGVDMRKTTTVKRKVILENMETFARKIIEVPVTTGPFTLQLLQADAFGLSKINAWSKVNIDVGKLTKGDYRIYVTSDSNITDYGEMNDVLFADLTKANGTIDGKKISLSLNENLRNRIELHIK